MLLVLVFVGILALSVEGTGNPFNSLPLELKDIANLLVALKEDLYCGCVNTLFAADWTSPGLQETKALTHLSRLISQHGVQTSTLKAEALKLDLEIKCQQRSCLFAILSASDPMRTALENVSSYGNTSISGQRWVLFLDEGIDVNEFFARVHVPFDCKFLVVFKPKGDDVMSRDLFFLKEVYRVARGYPLESATYGHWDNSLGLKTSSRKMYDKRNNLRGLNIRATTINEPPITMLIEEDERPLRVDGYFGRVWGLLEEQMNFTTTFTKSRDNAWGTYDPGTGWNGMIRMIQDREVDVAVTEFMMTAKRAEVVDFTLPLLHTKYIVIAKSPTGLDTTDWTAILAPFTLPLWLMVLSTILVISFQLNALHRLGRYFGNSEAHGPPEYTLYNSLHYTFGAFCQQGHNTTPRSASCQMVYLVAYFTAVVLLASYSAALISFLTQQQTTLPFNDLEGLLNDGRYQLAVLNKSAEYYIFNTSNNQVMKKLFEKYLEPHLDNLPTTPQEGLARVCSDSWYTFFMSYDIALGAVSHVTCDLTVLPGVSMYAGLSIAMAKENPYSGLINHNLQAFSDSGLLQRLRALYWPKMLPQADTTYIPVHSANVAPVFTLLLSGVICSIAILMAELWRHKKIDTYSPRDPQDVDHKTAYPRYK